MSEETLEKGVVYPATVRGVDWVNPSLYLGERKYSPVSPKAHLVAFRDVKGRAFLRGFTRFELKKGVLVMKFMYTPQIPDRERAYLETKLREVGI